jgi:hypothetical protein
VAQHPPPRPLSRRFSRIVPRVVARNGRLKLAALGLAVFLWALVRTEPTTGVNVFTVPVRAQVGDLDWVLEGEPDPATVQVRLRGPTQELIRIAQEGATLRVPLDSVTGADTVVQLRRDWVMLGSSGVVVEDIAPATVRLLLQPVLARVLPVRVVTRGSLSGELAFAAPAVLDPPTVRVRGPADRLRAIDSIPLAAFDLGDVRESGVHELAIDTAGLDGVSVTPLAATMTLRIEPALERTLAAVPVVVEDAAGSTEASRSFVITPAAIEVRLSGARAHVTAVSADDVRAVAPWSSVSAIPPGEARLVPIELRGLPRLVRAFSGADSVLVRRTGR